tara:strand:- start:1281 stop:1910 length:630 start_codon:yes stop_codon:yes gene_type:complete
MTFDKDFKEAISHLPSSEKDKLILRLLKKDLVLANRLYFELLDDKTVDDRRAEMEKRVKERISRATDSFWTTGYLKMDMRYLSGEITDHVRTTKDKYGEASLNLLMLNEVLSKNNHRILEAIPSKARKICVYIIARAFKILMIIQKLHEDHLIDFKDDLVLLGELIGQNDYLMKNAIQNGFDVNWLLKVDIPEDIAQIHKNLRANGFLK